MNKISMTKGPKPTEGQMARLKEIAAKNGMFYVGDNKDMLRAVELLTNRGWAIVRHRFVDLTPEGRALISREPT
jgi:hypothetical protein